MKKELVCLRIDDPQTFFENLDEYDNLILNMMSGLEPKDLSEDEIYLLKSRHGENWLKELGYET